MYLLLSALTLNFLQIDTMVQTYLPTHADQHIGSHLHIMHDGQIMCSPLSQAFHNAHIFSHFFATSTFRLQYPNKKRSEVQISSLFFFCFMKEK